MPSPFSYAHAVPEKKWTRRIAQLVERLPHMEDVSDVIREAERELAQGNAVFVADLGVALARRHGQAAAGTWQYRSVADQLLRLLSLTPGPGHAEQAARLAAVTPPTPSGRTGDAYEASLLAQGHSANSLAFVFAGGSGSARVSEELRAGLLQELVMRGVPVRDIRGAERWWRTRRYHPLAWLPLHLSDLERDPPLRSDSLRSGGATMPYGPAEGTRVTPQGPIPTVRETTTEDFREAAGATVANWVKWSNGHCEAASYESRDPIRAGALPSLLPALGLESTRTAPGTPLAVTASDPSYAWRELFAAAANGGAYSDGEYGARGRLAAWRSLAALSGAPAGASFEEVEETVRSCEWFSFGGATEWFDYGGWNIGWAVLGGGGRVLRVLAGVDVD